MCLLDVDGESTEHARVELPVHMPRGKVTDTSELLRPGDHVAVSGFVCSEPPRGPRPRVRPYRIVANHVDEGFLSYGECVDV